MSSNRHSTKEGSTYSNTSSRRHSVSGSAYSNVPSFGGSYAPSVHSSRIGSVSGSHVPPSYARSTDSTHGDMQERHNQARSMHSQRGASVAGSTTSQSTIRPESRSGRSSRAPSDCPPCPPSTQSMQYSRRGSVAGSTTSQSTIRPEGSRSGRSRAPSTCVPCPPSAVGSNLPMSRHGGSVAPSQSGGSMFPPSASGSRFGGSANDSIRQAVSVASSTAGPKSISSSRPGTVVPYAGASGGSRALQQQPFLPTGYAQSQGQMARPRAPTTVRAPTRYPPTQYGPGPGPAQPLPGADKGYERTTFEHKSTGTVIMTHEASGDACGKMGFEAHLSEGGRGRRRTIKAGDDDSDEDLEEIKQRLKRDWGY